MSIQEILELGTTMTEMGFVLTALYALLLWIIARIVLKAYRRMCQRAIEKKGKTAATTTVFFGSILKVLVYGLALYLILTQFTAFRSLGNLVLGTSSVLGVAVALAAQDSMANLVGGIFLSLYQPFRVHDLISLPDKNITGRIKEIGMRHTVLVTYANTEVIIPNSVMNSAIIENLDTGGKYSNKLTFSVGYQTDLDQAIRIIEQQALRHPLVLDLRSEEEKKQGVSLVSVAVSDLGAYAIDLRLSFYTADAGSGFSACSDLRKNVKKAFDQAGIVIPYPTSEIIASNKASM